MEKHHAQKTDMIALHFLLSNNLGDYTTQVVSMRVS